MKRMIIFMATAMTVLAGCRKEDYGWVKTGIDRACSQLLLTAENIDGTGQMPRSIWVGYDLDMLSYQLGKNKEEFKDSLRAHPGSDKIGKLRLCGIYDWTSGFFPGSLWYAYGDSKPTLLILELYLDEAHAGDDIENQLADNSSIDYPMDENVPFPMG